MNIELINLRKMLKDLRDKVISILFLDKFD